jgi:hypothetical protein
MRIISLVLALLLSSALVFAGTAIKLDTQALVDRSEWVIEGRVLSVRVIVGPSGRPETEYSVSVDVPYWGGPEGLRVFRFPGGVLPDGSGMVVPGLPVLREGEDVILFLTAESRAGWRMPVGLSQAKYRRLRDAHGRDVVVREHADLKLLDTSTGQVQNAAATERKGYAELRAEIEAAVKLRREREARPGEQHGEAR